MYEIVLVRILEAAGVVGLLGFGGLILYCMYRSSQR